MKFPITEIHEIELSSECNLACVYCPYPTMERAKAPMDWDTFQLTMNHVAYYVQKGTQGEVSLTGIGEAMLHPQFVDAMFLVRSVIGARKMIISTNGIGLTREMAVHLRHAQVQVYVSLHRPEVASKALNNLYLEGCMFSYNKNFVDSSMNWAGQVKWHVSAGAHECQYLEKGWAVVRQNGSVDMCCMDALDAHPIGHVRDEPGTLLAQVTPLCAACHLVVPQKYYQEQVAA